MNVESTIYKSGYGTLRTRNVNFSDNRYKKKKKIINIRVIIRRLKNGGVNCVRSKESQIKTIDVQNHNKFVVGRYVQCIQTQIHNSE